MNSLAVHFMTNGVENIHDRGHLRFSGGRGFSGRICRFCRRRRRPRLRARPADGRTAAASGARDEQACRHDGLAYEHACFHAIRQGGDECRQAAVPADTHRLSMRHAALASGAIRMAEAACRGAAAGHHRIYAAQAQLGRRRRLPRQPDTPGGPAAGCSGSAHRRLRRLFRTRNGIVPHLRLPYGRVRLRPSGGKCQGAQLRQQHRQPHYVRRPGKHRLDNRPDDGRLHGRRLARRIPARHPPGSQVRSAPVHCRQLVVDPQADLGSRIPLIYR
ncbi:hypothetical protein BN871_BM_00510 [Paenibacillus sp. P22]|nr:hypothetical protein BN871_BM_00510 [Paenibacillus sp. P22]